MVPCARYRVRADFSFGSRVGSIANPQSLDCAPAATIAARTVGSRRSAAGHSIAAGSANTCYGRDAGLGASIQLQLFR
jgi:hypothetical protein